MSDTTTTERGMTCPHPGCEGVLEASTRVYLDVVAAHLDGETVVLDDLEFSHLNDQLDGQPCNVEGEFDLTCDGDGHQFTWALGEGLRARLGVQPIGNAERQLGTRGMDDRYRITGDVRPDVADPGRNTAHWSTMGDAAENLAAILDEMAAMTRLWRGDMDAENPADVIALSEMDIDLAELSGDNGDLAYQQLDAWALEISTARWVGHDGTPGDVARVEIVLGTGGPHVEAEIVCGKGGEPERVGLNRYWSQSDQATTTDPRALTIAAEFVDAFVVVE